MNIMVFFSVSMKYTEYYGLLLSQYEIYSVYTGLLLSE